MDIARTNKNPTKSCIEYEQIIQNKNTHLPKTHTHLKIIFKRISMTKRCCTDKLTSKVGYSLHDSTITGLNNYFVETGSSLLAIFHGYNYSKFKADPKTSEYKSQFKI